MTRFALMVFSGTRMRLEDLAGTSLSCQQFLKAHEMVIEIIQWSSQPSRCLKTKLGKQQGAIDIVTACDKIYHQRQVRDHKRRKF